MSAARPLPEPPTRGRRYQPPGHNHGSLPSSASHDDAPLQDQWPDKATVSWSLVAPLKIVKRKPAKAAVVVGDWANCKDTAAPAPPVVAHGSSTAPEPVAGVLPPAFLQPLTPRALNARPRTRSGDDDEASNYYHLKPAGHSAGTPLRDKHQDQGPTTSASVEKTVVVATGSLASIAQQLLPSPSPQHRHHPPQQREQRQEQRREQRRWLWPSREDDENDTMRKIQKKAKAKEGAHLEADAAQKTLAELKRWDVAGRQQHQHHHQQDQEPPLQLSASLQLESPVPVSGRLPSSSLSSPPPLSSSSSSLSNRKPSHSSPVLQGTLSFLTGGRTGKNEDKKRQDYGADSAALSPVSTQTTVPLRSMPASTVSPASVGASASLGNKGRLAPSAMSQNYIEAGGRGQTDAPRGASNGADRRVLVRCRGVAMDLVVHVDTTATDILLACADEVSQPINASTCILKEVCPHLGLERRIRRYERIRDILNSWDDDAQNTLLVCPDAGEAGSDLELASVSRTEKPPSGLVVQLYHSHRPGKWDKRYVTLMVGGQITVSRKPESGSSNKDVVSICHLSDYDIYSPTEAQMRKQLRPPKKYCYAIKSQQRTTVFVNTENYMHFFCTEDREAAQEFYHHVHRWRSWYVANRLLQLHTTKQTCEAEKPPQILPEKHTPRKTVGHVKVGGHKVQVSVDESPYTIGTFEPLINLKRFDKPLDEFGKDWEPDLKRSSSRSIPLAASLKQAAKSGGSGSRQNDQNRPAFIADSLLGTAYNERKRAQMEANKETQLTSAPSSSVAFTPGPSLLNSHPPNSSVPTTRARPPSNSVTSEPSLGTTTSNHKQHGAAGWFPSAVEHTAKARSNTAPVGRPGTSSGAPSLSHRSQPSSPQQQQQQQQRRGPLAPLVDLAPTFVEAPQWSREGRGRGYHAPMGKPLVDFATGPQAVPGSAGRFVAGVPPKNLMRREDPITNNSNVGGSGAFYSGVMPSDTDDGRSVYSGGRRPTVSSATSSAGGNGYHGPHGQGPSRYPPPSSRGREPGERHTSLTSDSAGGYRPPSSRGVSVPPSASSARDSSDRVRRSGSRSRDRAGERRALVH